MNAPLLQLANINRTPNPSKAPWYFLGLQELLTMFHPMVAGVTIPGMGIFALMLAPYIDRNPSQQAGGPQVRHLDLHHLPDVLGRARDHRLVLPRSGVQLHVPLAGRASSSTCEETSMSSGSHHRHRHRRLVVLGVLVFVTAAVATTAQAAGALRRETRRRDRKAAAASTSTRTRRLTGRDGRADRARPHGRRHCVPVVEAPPPPASGCHPTPRRSAYTRRQFFNRVDRGADGC